LIVDDSTISLTAMK